jgi:hypothetical protein
MQKLSGMPKTQIFTHSAASLLGVEVYRHNKERVKELKKELAELKIPYDDAVAEMEAVKRAKHIAREKYNDTREAYEDVKDKITYFEVLSGDRKPHEWPGCAEDAALEVLKGNETHNEFYES